MIQPLPIHELANIVPRATSQEQEALDHSIAHKFRTNLGSILLWKGAIVDGRNRQESCIKANLDPRDYSVELSTTETYQEVEELVLSAQIRRNLTDTQKAISAYRTSLLKGNTQESSAKQWGVSLRAIKYTSALVKTIQKVPLLLNIIYYGVPTTKGIKFYQFVHPDPKRAQGHFSKKDANSLLDRLAEDCSIRVLLQDGEKWSSKSIKSITQRLTILLEEQALIIAEEPSIEWEPDSHILTETGKQHYYSLVNGNNVPIPICIELVKYMNLKYQLPSISEPISSTL